MAWDPIQILISAKDEASAAFARVRDALSVVTDGIKSKLDLESSEIAMQRKKLDAVQAEQQSLLKIAAARGDELVAARAREALRAVEAQKLELLARAKEAEAAALEKTTSALREELAAAGPLTQQQQQRLQASENAAKALQIESQAARQSAQSVLSLGQAEEQATLAARAQKAAEEQSAAAMRAGKQAVEDRADAIQQGLRLVQSEIELRRRHLESAQAEQQSILKAAAARGDELVVLKASATLREIEAQKLGLTAQAKRAEADAVRKTVDARREEIAAIGPLTKAQTDEIKALENKARALNVDAAAADQAAARTRNFTEVQKAATKETKELAKGASGLSSAFDGLSARLSAIGAAVAGYFGIRAFSGMVQGAADFEQAMSRVQAATGASAQEMAALRKAAEDAGANTKFTASQAAESLENLAKAGLNSAEAIETLPAVMALAQAAGIGLGESAEYITKAVMGMGLQFADAGRVADVLAKGANASNTSVTGLAQALSYTAPIAKSLGVSLESTVAIIGKLADGGIDASRAGTGLASIMAQFSDPSSKFKQALLGAGIATKDFEAALRQLAAAGPRAESAILAVGLEAGPALRSLLNQGMGALDELTEKLRNSSGAAAEAARVMNDNLNGSLVGLSSAWDTVKNTLLTPVLPVLKDGVDKLAASLRGAVSDGTIAQFGAALKTAFEGGIKWAQEFVSSVDFKKVTADMRVFAAQVGTAFENIGRYAKNSADVVKTAYGVMSGGANAVMSGIYGIAASYTEAAIRIVDFTAKWSESIAKIAIGDTKKKLLQQAEDMRGVLQGLAAVRDAYIAKTIDAFNATADSAQTARDGFISLATESSKAAGSTDELAVELERLRTELDAQEAAYAKDISAMEQATIAQIQKTAADTNAAQALKDLRDKLALLRQEYEALLNAGDVQNAVEKLKEVQRATDELARAQQSMGQQGSEAAKQFSASLTSMGVNADAAMGRVSGAAENAINGITSLEKSAKAAGLGVQQTARAMEMAFAAAIPKADTLESVEALKTKLKQLGDSGQVSADGMARLQQALEKQKGTIEDNIPGIQSLGEALRALGVKPQAELKAMADKAKEAFEVVRNSGTAAPREINQAWKAMAEAAIAANDGIADSTVTAEAAAHGYKVAVDDAGKATIKSMEGAKDAAEMAGDAGKQAGEDTAEGAAKAAQSVDQLVAAFFTAQNAASKYASQINELMWQQAGYGSMSEQNFAQMSAAANRAVQALEDLDRAQAQLEASGSSAAGGLADLELRMLQLSGTEEDVARERARREAAELARKTALMALEVQRLEMLAKDNVRDPEGAKRAKEDLEKARIELDYLAKQRQLLDEVQQAEAADRAKKAEQQKKEEAERKREEEARKKEAASAAASGDGQRPGTAPAPTSAEPGGSRPGAIPARTVNLVLSLGGGERETLATDDDGAAAMERFLRSLETAKRNTGR